MGLDPEKFWNLSYYEYSVMADGYFRRDERKWAHTRYIAHFLYNQMITKNSEVKTPQQLIPLFFDQVEKPASKRSEPVTMEEFNKILEKLKNARPVDN